MEDAKRRFLETFANGWSCQDECKLTNPVDLCPFGAYDWIGTINPCYMIGRYIPAKELRQIVGQYFEPNACR